MLHVSRIGMARLGAVLAIVAILAVAVVAASAGASSVSLVGSWKGYLNASGKRVSFSVTVRRGERSGTWKLGTDCAGTLKLKDISDGYHHYYRVAGRNAGCSVPGVDCVKRAGSGLFDWFVPNAGGNGDTGTLHRR